MSGTLSPVQRPPSTIPGGTRPLSPLRAIGRQSHTSVSSWISHLASSNPPPISSTPKPISVAMPVPDPNDSESPTPTVKTISGSDYSHPPLQLKGLNEKGYESVLKLEVPAWPQDKEKELGDFVESPVEVDTHASPTSRKSRARSFVGGFVTGLRSIPRAVTHSSVYDRRTGTSSGKYSSRTESQMFEGPAAGGTGVAHPQLWYRVPPPPLASLEHGRHRHPGHGHIPVPILLAHPPPPGIPGIPHYAPRLSTIGSEYYSKQGSSTGEGSISSRLGDFLGELSSLPWISQGRVAVDYLPGETHRARSPRSGSSGSWYSINPPATPSDISNRWKYVPEPWFPPTQLPPTQEVDEQEEHAQQGGAAGPMDEENFGEKLERVQAELQEKIQELDSMRQVVEHQKKHIGALETEIAELRGAQSQNDIRRWRSSTRKSLSTTGYRKRDSVRTVTSARRPSASRPASSFYED